MGQLLDTLLAKSFRPVKCKSLLDQTILRTVRLKSQREIIRNAFKKDVAELLKKEERTSALSKIDDVFREQNMIDVYVLIQGFCSDVIKKMPFIEKQKSCPNGLREAISSLCFAAQRCAELPELQQIRYIFSSKYGREFTATLPEVQSDSGVNKEMSQKLSARKPSGYVKVKLIKEIANENGIGWKFENFMDGSDCFTEPMKINQSSRRSYEASSVPENTNHVSELDKWPVHSQPLKRAPEMSTSPPLSPISSLDDDEKHKMHNIFCAKNGNGKLLDTENYDSPLHFGLENRKKSSVRLTRSGELGLSERDQKSSLRGNDKSVQSKGKRTKNYNDDHPESPTGNGCCNSARYSRADELYVEYKGLKIRYTDAATAAHEALDSAEHATMAAHAALTLASREYNQNSSQTDNDSSEISSNSSDEAFERSFLRDTNEQWHSNRILGFQNCGVSKCSEKQRGTHDHSDIECRSICNDVPDRKKAQGGREFCVNKPIYNWAKPKSNNQQSPSRSNHLQSILDDFKSDRGAPLSGRKQYRGPNRVPNRCMSEIRLRPRMSIAEEAETQRSQSPRLSNSIQSDDFERIKFKFRSKTPMPRKSKPFEFYGNDEPYQDTASARKIMVSQISQKEGLRKSEGSGKGRWYSGNLQDQETHFISIDEIGSMNSNNNGGTDSEIRSYMNGDFSTDLEVNQIIHSRQEKISRSKNVGELKDSKLNGKNVDCARIDLDRQPKSLRSWRMQFPSKTNE